MCCDLIYSTAEGYKLVKIQVGHNWIHLSWAGLNLQYSRKSGSNNNPLYVTLQLQLDTSSLLGHKQMKSIVWGPLDYKLWVIGNVVSKAMLNILTASY